jgi:Protein of unknown function (DUF3124)
MDRSTGFRGKKWLASGGAALVVLIALVVGTQQHSSQAADAQAAPDPAINAARGELVYVPIYSSIFYENGKHTLELAATLSIHNVNPESQITVTRADYYDTDGKLIKKYLDKPLLLNALQTKNLVIDKENKTGGTGANFLVEWQSKQGTTSPVIEALMVNASSNLGIAFTTTGKVIRQSPVVAK